MSIIDSMRALEHSGLMFTNSIVASLLISQLVLIGLLSIKGAANSTPILVMLFLLTIWFHKHCKDRFKPAFRKYPLEEVIYKDAAETESLNNLKEYIL
ncbi:hypothetical protein QQ045_016896 [Rhodiola kirilowii]